MNEDKLVQGKDEMGQEIIEAQVTLRVEFMQFPSSANYAFVTEKGLIPSEKPGHAVWYVKAFLA